ncbi:MAG: 16S rRNA (adenine(1518)-N(6)/adenine(1519)-N(6))-dimethyltransferase RsmA [Chitinophagaceae bacterium]|jgi:16S rRNA (adenine1518-N6/adenine1519-N6)-dimethyltransferase
MYTLKKSLGQHFLKDDSICERIVEALQQTPFQRLLEVGPGGGALTKFLIKIPDIDFKLVEIDKEKVEFLTTTFPQLKDKITEASILDVDLPFDQPFTLIGNFPYNISTQIVFRVIEWREQVETMIGMFQKEVAERICAGPGNKEYGILSVLSQAYFKTTYLFDVDEEAFNPPPKVKSGVIKFEYIGNPYGIESHRKFLVLVKAAFGQRRKQLRNPLKPYFKKEVLQDEIFTKRAEQLSVADFVGLLNKMN